MVVLTSNTAVQFKIPRLRAILAPEIARLKKELAELEIKRKG